MSKNKQIYIGDTINIEDKDGNRIRTMQCMHCVKTITLNEQDLAIIVDEDNFVYGAICSDCDDSMVERRN